MTSAFTTAPDRAPATAAEALTVLDTLRVQAATATLAELLSIVRRYSDIAAVIAEADELTWPAETDDLVALGHARDQAAHAWQERARSSDVRRELLGRLGPPQNDPGRLTLVTFATDPYLGTPARVLTTAFTVGPPRTRVAAFRTVVLALPSWAARNLEQYRYHANFGMDVFRYQVLPVASMPVADTAARLWNPDDDTSAYQSLDAAVAAAHALMASP